MSWSPVAPVVKIVRVLIERDWVSVLSTPLLLSTDDPEPQPC